MEKISHENGHEKKAGIAILISDKIDFKTKALTRNKEGLCIIFKEVVQHEDITLVDICTQYRNILGT